MTEDNEDQIYEVDVVYHDSGISLEFPMDQWRNRIEEDFTSFDAIKEFYRTDLEELVETVSEEAEEIPVGAREGPGIYINNPPKEWKEDMGQAVPLLRFAEEKMVHMGLFSLVENEVEKQRELLDSGQYKPLIIRQSAFLEKYFELQSQLKFQRQKEAPLSNKEMDVIEGMGHTDRIRLAHLLGVIDEEQHGNFQAMASFRNELAHNPWNEVSPEKERNIENTSKWVFGELEDFIERGYAEIEQNSVAGADSDFNIGFEGLDKETEIFQLGLLSVIRNEGGKISLSKLSDIMPQSVEKVRQRCLRMDHIGYVDLDKENEVVSIGDQGLELLKDYWDK